VNRGLLLSLSLHTVFLSVCLLGPRPKSFEWDRVDAVPVDLVALPHAEEPAAVVAPAAEPAPAPVREVEPAEASAAKPKEAKADTPAVRPKPRRVIKPYAPPRDPSEPSLAERLRERLDETEPAPVEEAPAAAPAPASSAVVEAVDFPYAWYLNLLRGKVTAAWDPPGERLLAGRSRHVVVRFRILRDGRITDVRVDSASGTPGLDVSAERAIQQGGPYPPLPETYTGEWLDVGVRFSVREDGG
jgi:TonB family protein